MTLPVTVNRMVDAYAAISEVISDSAKINTTEFDYLLKAQANFALIIARLMTALKEEGYAYISV